MDRRKFMGTAALGTGLVLSGRASSAQMDLTDLRDCMDLANLDYFEINDDDELVLSDGVADRIIDAHTHIGFSFLGGPPVDLDREDEDIKTFFPATGNRVDLTKYSGKSFDEVSGPISQKETVKKAFTKSGFAGTHTPKNLLKDMDRNRITHSILLAIDFNLGALSRNSEHFMKACRMYPQLIPFVSVHPGDMLMEHKTRKFREQGAIGMKIHPPMQFVRANSRKCMKLTKLCGELGMPAFFHSGASDIQPEFQKDYCRIEHWWTPVQAHPETTFVLAHGGIYFWEDLIELAVENENVWIELSGQPPSHIKQMIDAGLEDRMMFGSDWPYYIEALPLAKVLLATEGAPEIREKIIYSNARRLLEQAGFEF